MAAGCGAANSCGRAVVCCAAAEESRLPTECAEVALEQLVGSEPDRKRKSHVKHALTDADKHSQVMV
jgi:hypothetical protein